MAVLAGEFDRNLFRGWLRGKERICSSFRTWCLHPDCLVLAPNAGGDAWSHSSPTVTTRITHIVYCSQLPPLHFLSCETHPVFMSL